MIDTLNNIVLSAWLIAVTACGIIDRRDTFYGLPYWTRYVANAVIAAVVIHRVWLA